MKECLFCREAGPFTTVEHVVPESLGNDDLVLKGEVCDQCQNYFGKEVERFVLEKTSLAFWRTHLGIRTKKGRLPHVDLSLPSREKGILPSIHPSHDNGLGFAAHRDGSVSVDIDNDQIIREVLQDDRRSFKFVITPKIVQLLARFLLKVGLEIVASVDTQAARSPCYDDARQHARHGSGDRLWPLFHFNRGEIRTLRKLEQDGKGWLEHVQCYEYSLLDVDEYKVFHFSMGTDHFVVSLSHRYPDPRIRAAFPGETLSPIWYPDVA